MTHGGFFFFFFLSRYAAFHFGDYSNITAGVKLTGVLFVIVVVLWLEEKAKIPLRDHLYRALSFTSAACVLYSCVHECVWTNEG